MHKNLQTTENWRFHRRFCSLFRRIKAKIFWNTLTHIHNHRKKCDGGGKKSTKAIKLETKRKKNFNAIIIFYPRLMNAAHFHLTHATKLNRLFCFIHSHSNEGERRLRLPSGAGPVFKRQAGKNDQKRREWNGRRKNPINFTFSFFSLPFKPYRSRILMKTLLIPFSCILLLFSSLKRYLLLRRPNTTFSHLFLWFFLLFCLWSFFYFVISLSLVLTLQIR